VTVPEAAAPVLTLEAPLLPVQEPPAPEVLAPHPILDAPVLDTPVHAAPRLAGNRAATWPCTGCGTAVPIEEMACPSCGAGFLAPERSRTSLVLPGIGDITELSQSGRVMLMAGGCLAVTLVLFVLFVLFGGLV
jgi:hypothetical protein